MLLNILQRIIQSPRSRVPRCRNPELDPATLRVTWVSADQLGQTLGRGSNNGVSENSPGESLKMTGSTLTNWKMNETANQRMCSYPSLCVHQKLGKGHIKQFTSPPCLSGSLQFACGTDQETLSLVVGYLGEEYEEGL